MEAVEGDAVADVEAFRLVASPREDVGGDEQFADGQTGEGAAVGVVVEHDFAEVVLPASLFGGAGDFGFAGRRTRNLADAGAALGKPGQVIAAAMDEPNDPAAVFACALSLHTACWKAAKSDPAVNLSDAYQGGDQFMREMMRVADLFETWACEHVAFEALDDVWPYLLENHFGDACLAFMEPGGFAGFDHDDCLRVAFRLQLPVWADCGVPVPVFVERAHPVSTSTFRFLRIRTVRDSLVENGVDSFNAEDDPFDEEFSAPYFGIYGLEDDGTVEHIADRDSYAGARELMENLLPGIGFPERAVGMRVEGA